jgi:hypothetical protein
MRELVTIETTQGEPRAKSAGSQVPADQRLFARDCLAREPGWPEAS